jgi:hypothetical protein
MNTLKNLKNYPQRCIDGSNGSAERRGQHVGRFSGSACWGLLINNTKFEKSQSAVRWEVMLVLDIVAVTSESPR